MDWLIDTSDTDTGSARALALLEEHLKGHAVDPSRVDRALGAVGDRVGSVVRTAQGRPLHVVLDWTSAEPTLSFAAVESADTTDRVELGAPVPARLRAQVRSWPREQLETTKLTSVSRRTQHTFDSGPPPVLSDAIDPDGQGPAAVALALATAMEAHPSASAPQTASIAGAMLANAAAGDAKLPDGQAVADTFVDVHRALGSDAHVVEVGPDRLEVAVSRCPFQAKPGASSSICHVSTGLAGQLAARVHGSATVMLDETIIAGDPECHLQVLLREPADEETGEAYFWPPRAAAGLDSVPHLDLSVALPRESVSVPVVRRLAAQALRAFGVHDPDVDDVQLAITEACANVIDHATATDTYDVKIELAADRCVITVVDQGRGFDATQVPERPQDDSEEGRGLALMRALVDNVAFRNEPQAGAVVHMVKSLEYDANHPLRQR